MLGFATFPAKRDRGEIRTIGFDHEFPKRDICCDLPHGYAIFESNDSRERNQMVEIKNFIRLIERTAKAMKNTSHFAGVSTQNFQRVGPCVALMNHDV